MTRQASPRWLLRDEVATTTCATRIAQVSHVGRHYALAVPAPPLPSASPPVTAGVRMASHGLPVPDSTSPRPPAMTRPRVVDDDITTICTPRAALPSHVSRHYAFALPPPTVTNVRVLSTLSPSAGELRPLSPTSARFESVCSRNNVVASNPERSIDEENPGPRLTSVIESLADEMMPTALGNERMLPTSAREPVDVDAARFIGATIQLFDAEVLVVQVAPRVITDRGEAPAVVGAFQARFKRTIVLVAQDRRGVPTFFGPGPIAKVLAKIPFEALAWKRYRYRPPRPMMLPIPIDPPRDPSESFEYAYDSDGEKAYLSVDRRGAIATRDLAGKRNADCGGRLPGTTRSLGAGADRSASHYEVHVRTRNLGGTTHPDARSTADRVDVRTSTDRGLGAGA